MSHPHEPPKGTQPLDQALLVQATRELRERMDQLNSDIIQLAHRTTLISSSRELSLVRTKLEEAGFWARAGVERLDVELAKVGG